MKRFTLALTALATTVAVAPYAYATPTAPSAEALQGELQVEIPVSEALAAIIPDSASVETTHINKLNRAETRLNQLSPETVSRDTVSGVIVIEL